MDNLWDKLLQHSLKIASALLGLNLFFLFLIFGNIFNAAFYTSIPAVACGMLAFLACLVLFQLLFKKPPSLVKETSNVLLPLFPLFILPSCIGIVNQLSLLKTDGIKIFIALLIGIVLTQIITPIIFIRVTKLFNKSEITTGDKS